MNGQIRKEEEPRPRSYDLAKEELARRGFDPNIIDKIQDWGFDADGGCFMLEIPVVTEGRELELVRTEVMFWWAQNDVEINLISDKTNLGLAFIGLKGITDIRFVEPEVGPPYLEFEKRLPDKKNFSISVDKNGYVHAEEEDI